MFDSKGVMGELFLNFPNAWSDQIIVNLSYYKNTVHVRNNMKRSLQEILIFLKHECVKYVFDANSDSSIPDQIDKAAKPEVNWIKARYQVLVPMTRYSISVCSY